jgi:hypothetical protein
MKDFFAALSASLLAAAGLFAATSAPSGKTSGRSAAPKPSACSACREKGTPIDPSALSEADAASRPAYAAASKYPETIDKIHCYCGCEDSPNLHHKSLLTCFTTLHATGCEICRGEAELAGKMKGEGSADEDIKQVVEAFYRKD